MTTEVPPYDPKDHVKPDHVKPAVPPAPKATRPMLMDKAVVIFAGVLLMASTASQPGTAASFAYSLGVILIVASIIAYIVELMIYG